MTADFPTAPVLQMRGICKQYPGVRALSGADLEVRAGDVHVLLGENGAGKSTLMKILSGAVSPDAGEVLLGGARVDLGDPRRVRRLGISTIYQELSLVAHLSVAENIYLGKAPTRWAGVVDWARMRRDASRILEHLGVEIESGCGGAQSQARAAADGRGRARPCRRCPRPDHGRADLGAQRARSGSSSLRPSPG